MEVHALQVLGATDVAPEKSLTAVHAVDSETGEELSLALDQGARAQYTQLLTQHTAEIRNHCLSHQIQFASAIAANNSPEDVAVATLSRMGLFV
jgi:hypothetical protein